MENRSIQFSDLLAEALREPGVPRLVALGL
jgi:hypothetical protein